MAAHAPPARRRRSRGAVAALTFLLVAASAVVACSLGLDESLLDRAPVTPTADGGPPGGDGGGQPDGAIPGRVDAATCAKDEDCVTNDACLRGRCDVARGACAFDVCRPAACSAGACDTAGRTCGEAKPFPFKATQFAVGTPASCGRCFAAVHPYVFVGTAAGVVAFNVANPTAAPAPVLVTGLGFAPTAFVASGSRVFFMGAPIGGGPPSRLPVAWADVPSDPFVTTIAVQNTLAVLNRPSTDPVALFAREADTALVIVPQAPLQFPSAVVQAPFVDPFRIDTAPIPFTANTAPVGVSGNRLLMQAVDVATGTAAFGFVQNAGAANPQNAGAAPVDGGGVVYPNQTFAQAADGAVLWSYTTLTIPPGTPTPSFVRAVHTAFLVAGAAAPVDTGRRVDVEVYAPNTVPAGTGVVGPVAPVDANQAIVVAAARENINQTSVQFVRREPLGLVTNADNTTPRRAVLPIAIGTVVAAAGSNGVGYVLANEAATPTVAANASVYVFDPACAP